MTAQLLALAGLALSSGIVLPQERKTERHILPSETELVAAVLVAECGGEKDPRAFWAVKEVIENRMRERNQSARQVVTARLQFSCLNRMTPQELILKMQHHPRFREALILCGGVIWTNYTHGANHYFATTIKTPVWAEGKTPTEVIGHHAFFKL